VIATVDPPEAVPAWIAYLAAGGVLAGPMGHGRLRFVTHLDVDDDGIDRAIARLRARDV
jgi:threonine aldolase